MSEINLECQGLPCPQPVLRCKKCLDEQRPMALTVTVDNEAARENVIRFLSSQGYQAASERRQDGLWAVTGKRSGEPDAGPSEPCRVMSGQEMEAVTQKVVAFITAETVGRGDDTLGSKLMLNFLSTLPELGSTLWRVILVNGGVKLSAGGHPAADKLRALADAGATVLVCGTCLDHFGLLDKKVVGETTNMLDVVTSLQLATKVIQI